MNWIELTDDNPPHITRLLNLDTVTDIVKISDNECHFYFTTVEGNNQTLLIVNTDYNKLKQKILNYKNNT